jgi:hypothetical protein
MSRRDDLIKWANAQPEEACAGACDVLGIPQASALPDGCVPANIPGAPGLVRLTGVPSTSFYAAMAHAIEEVGLSYPDGSPERNFVMTNVQNANGMENIEGQLAFTPVCYPLMTDGTLDNAHGGFFNTRADASKDRNGVDKFKTVAEATAHWASVPNPGQGSPYHGPHN